MLSHRVIPKHYADTSGRVDYLNTLKLFEDAREDVMRRAECTLSQINENFGLTGQVEKVSLLCTNPLRDQNKIKIYTKVDVGIASLTFSQWLELVQQSGEFRVATLECTIIFYDLLHQKNTIPRALYEPLIKINKP